MIKIEVIIFGKIKNQAIDALVQYYSKLIGHSIKLDITVLKDTASQKISLPLIPKRSKIIIVSEHGKQVDSIGFKNDLVDHIEQHSEVTYIFGNAFGFEPEVLNKYQKISLSKLTTTHELALVIFLEQIYRSFDLKKGGKYHK